MSGLTRFTIEFPESRPAGRTRAALFDAFIALVLDRRYDRLTVADIIARAGVGRSTFYEHYRGKDDLLREGLTGPFAVLADMVTDRHDRERLRATVAHFWENRRIGNVLFAGPTRLLATRTLAALIESRLTERPCDRAVSVPPALLAAQLAGGQLALIAAWLGGLAPASPDEVAEALYASVQAIERRAPGVDGL